MLNYTYLIWLFFAAFFFFNAYFHWREGEIPIRPFGIEEDSAEGAGGEAASKLSEAGQEFVRDFNAYLSSVNGASLRRHRAMAVGFGLSGGVALISMFLIVTGR